MIFTKTSGVNNSSFGKSQDPIRMFLEQQEEFQTKNSIIDSVFMMDSTENYAEKYTMETSLGNFTAVGEGGAYPRSSFQEGYARTIEPDEWKNSFEVTLQMLEDAKMGKAKQKAGGFMLGYARTRELFATSILNNGQSTSMSFGSNSKSFNIACADSLSLFNTAHTSVTGSYGTQSNYYSNPFSYDALALVEEQMQKYRDDDGNLLNVQPDTIVIPNNARIKKLVYDAIGAEEGAPGTANNSFNFHGNRWNVVFSPMLNNTASITAGTDSWYVMDSSFNDAYGGLIWLERVPLTVKSYIDENTDNNIFAARARYGAAPNNWRAICKSDPGLSGTLLA